MHVLACIVCKSEKHFKEQILKDPKLLDCVNKLRCCIFFEDSQTLNKDTFHESYVISVHEILVNYLTYIKNETGEWVHPSQPITLAEPKKYWISEVDVWFYLNPELRKRMLSLGSHIICYDNLSSLS